MNSCQECGLRGAPRSREGGEGDFSGEEEHGQSV